MTDTASQIPNPKFDLRTIGTIPENGKYLAVRATIRDFTPIPVDSSKFGNITTHPDFEMKDEENGGYGVVTGMVVQNRLRVDPKDGKPKPIYAPLPPKLNNAPWTDRHRWTTDEASFDLWFSADHPSVATEDIYLILKKDGNNYILDSSKDDDLKKLGGFFPIDGRLLGNYDPSDSKLEYTTDPKKIHNFHFTMEAHMQFIYKEGQLFSFSGDDDLWVFIEKSVNGSPVYQLIIDLGGVHDRADKTVNMDALGLTAGNTYGLHLFFAERHTTDSNLRIETSIEVLPEVQIYGTSDANKYGSINGEFKIKLSAAASSQLVINYQVVAAATDAKANDDYVALSGSVSVAPGSTEVSITVIPKGTGKVNEQKRLTLMLSQDKNYTVKGNPATISINNYLPSIGKP